MNLPGRHFSYYLNWLLLGLLAGLLFLFWQGRESALPGPAAAPAPASFADAIARVMPAVTSITTRTYLPQQSIHPRHNRLLDRFLAPGAADTGPILPKRYTEGSGSGVIIRSDGYILTNYHVIRGSDTIFVRLNDGRGAKGHLVGSDPETDLAVIKIDLDHLPTGAIGRSKNTRVGDIVLAIGDPFAIGQTVTQGIISATGRSIIAQNPFDYFLQTDAAINPGNSGGPLINTRGEIIGINSSIYSNTGGYQGIGFAIPVDMARKVAEQIIAHGHVIRGWLGLTGQPLTPAIVRSLHLAAENGILITQVDPDGPGARAGLQAGDIITHINQQPVTGARDILNRVTNGRPGDVFTVNGLRERQSFSTRITLGERPLLSR